MINVTFTVMFVACNDCMQCTSNKLIIGYLTNVSVMCLSFDRRQQLVWHCFPWLSWDQLAGFWPTWKATKAGIPLSDPVMVWKQFDWFYCFYRMLGPPSHWPSSYLNNVSPLTSHLPLHATMYYPPTIPVLLQTLCSLLTTVIKYNGWLNWLYMEPVTVLNKPLFKS